ncbi:hypothetical protein [Streptomyces sp. NPDC060022]
MNGRADSSARLLTTAGQRRARPLTTTIRTAVTTGSISPQC